MILATGRDSFPLFLHVLGAMLLVGVVLSALILTLAGPAIGQRRVFPTLLVAGIPSYLVMRVGAQWIYSSEGLDKATEDPAWIGIGFMAADIGALVLLVTIGVAFWWRRSGRPVAARIVAGLSAVYLLLLAVAWLAMSGKWG
jgi:hypothetical protein